MVVWQCDPADNAISGCAVVFNGREQIELSVGNFLVIFFHAQSGTEDPVIPISGIGAQRRLILELRQKHQHPLCPHVDAVFWNGLKPCRRTARRTIHIRAKMQRQACGGGVIPADDQS